MILFVEQIEETVLETLAWRSSSPLWDALANEDEVAGVEDVSFANQLERDAPASISMLSPLMNPALRRIAAGALTPTQKGCLVTHFFTQCMSCCYYVHVIVAYVFSGCTSFITNVDW